MRERTNQRRSLSVENYWSLAVQNEWACLGRVPAYWRMRGGSMHVPIAAWSDGCWTHAGPLPRRPFCLHTSVYDRLLINGNCVVNGGARCPLSRSDHRDQSHLSSIYAPDVIMSFWCYEVAVWVRRASQPSWEVGQFGVTLRKSPNILEKFSVIGPRRCNGMWSA